MKSVILATALLFLDQSLAAAQWPKRDELETRIDRALAFLKSMQEKDGAWTLSGQKNPAATSLAIMAFLAAGHVPGEGPHAESLEKAIRYVLSAQQANGIMAGIGGYEMYEHGICTLMLCEVYGMTDATLAREIKPKLEKAVTVILAAQRLDSALHRGGWRYRVDSPDADLSVTGWQLLALRAAKNIGCDVPGERIDLAMEYVQRCREPVGGGFCYLPGGRTTSACTGTGILALELCGKARHKSREALQAGAYLLKHSPHWGDEHFLYAAYYCAQGMFQLGHNYWNVFRPQLHKTLFDHQQNNGSWIGGDNLGPVYATSMAVLALTVEYRLLPIYQREEDQK